MPNISNKENKRKQKSYRDQVESGRKLVALWFEREKWDMIERAADSVQEPITNWIRRAVFSALRKWEMPESKILFEPCSICGVKHDKREHYPRS